MAYNKSLDNVCDLLTGISTQLTHITTQLDTIQQRVKSLEAPSVPKRGISGQQVWDTSELLEHILSQLPMRDLLLAQRVSRRFKAVIDSSDKIQQALFFKPAVLSPTDVPRINPLLSDYTNYRKTPIAYIDRPKVITFTNDLSLPFVAPAIFKAVANPEGEEEHVILTSFEHMQRDFPDPTMRLTPGKYVYGSWRRMYLSQPPTEVLYGPAAPTALHLESRAAGSLRFENIFTTLLYDFEFGWGAEIMEKYHLTGPYKGDLGLQARPVTG
ncbi:hypothetical protein KC349_g2202 [Hortaea werneckii]|nr:hypothetical protein KC349_g2202 [Hortaea werneckii]